MAKGKTNKPLAEKAGQENVLFRADPGLMEWWAKTAEQAGVSRNTLLNDVLWIVTDAVTNAEMWSRDDPSLGEFGTMIAERLATQGVAGENLRSWVLSMLRVQLRCLRESDTFADGKAIDGALRSSMERVYLERIAAIEKANANKTPEVKSHE